MRRKAVGGVSFRPEGEAETISGPPPCQRTFELFFRVHTLSPFLGANARNPVDLWVNSAEQNASPGAFWGWFVPFGPRRCGLRAVACWVFSPVGTHGGAIQRRIPPQVLVPWPWPRLWLSTIIQKRGPLQPWAVPGRAPVPSIGPPSACFRARAQQRRARERGLLCGTRAASTRKAMSDWASLLDARAN